MQMNISIEVSHIQKDFWECIVNPTLRKSSLLLCQFHGSVIKTFGCFEGSLELEDKFEVILIIVTSCKKNHGILENDMLNINSTKSINEIKMEKNGKLKNYKMSLKFKENVTSFYYETRKFPVNLLPLVVAKLRKLLEQDLLEHIPPGGSKWASPIVVFKKSDGDICTWGDYKIGVNHKVCSDSYPILNVKVAIHALAGMSVFTKIDSKTAYHQISIDNNFKEVTTINIPIGLMKWRRMPYRIKATSAIFQRAIEQISRRYKKKNDLLTRQYMHWSY